MASCLKAPPLTSQKRRINGGTLSLFFLCRPKLEGPARCSFCLPCPTLSPFWLIFCPLPTYNGHFSMWGSWCLCVCCISTLSAFKYILLLLCTLYMSTLHLSLCIWQEPVVGKNISPLPTCPGHLKNSFFKFCVVSYYIQIVERIRDAGLAQLCLSSPALSTIFTWVTVMGRWGSTKEQPPWGHPDWKRCPRILIHFHRQITGRCDCWRVEPRIRGRHVHFNIYRRFFPITLPNYLCKSLLEYIHSAFSHLPF